MRREFLFVFLIIVQFEMQLKYTQAISTHHARTNLYTAVIRLTQESNLEFLYLSVKCVTMSNALLFGCR